jgi:hypothetical protein
MYTSYWGHDIDLGDGDYSDGGASEDGEVDISPYAMEELVTIDGSRFDHCGGHKVARSTISRRRRRFLPPPSL